MSIEYNVFIQNYRSCIRVLIVSGFLLIVNAVSLIAYGGVVLLCMHFLLGLTFFVFLFPVIKNQVVIITGDEIDIINFGHIHKIDITKHLCELVKRDDEIVGYRFDNNENFFQISPSGYFLSKELQSQFKRLVRKRKIIVPVVNRKL